MILPCIIVMLEMFKEIAAASQPILFTTNSPWPQSSTYRSEGSCEYNLGRPYSVSEWKMNVTTDQPTTSIVLWVMSVKGSDGNSYHLENLHIEAAGFKTVKMHFEHTTSIQLSGFCHSSTDTQDTEPLSSVAIVESTQSNPTCDNVIQVCDFICNDTLTYQQIHQKASDLADLLKIDKTATAKAKSLKICASDNRPSAVAMGTLGIIVLLLTFGTVILSDIPIFITYLKRVRRIVRKRMKLRIH